MRRSVRGICFEGLSDRDRRSSRSHRWISMKSRSRSSRVDYAVGEEVVCDPVAVGVRVDAQIQWERVVSVCGPVAVVVGVGVVPCSVAVSVCVL